MKYFLDTEFMEGPQARTFLGFKIGETKPTIDLISIGIVAEDGRELYLVSKDFNLKEAWNRWQPNDDFLDGKEYWLRDNVLKPIIWELYQKDDAAWDSEFGNYNNFIGYLDRKEWSYKTFETLIMRYGKSNNLIAEEVKQFCTDEVIVSEINGKLVGSVDLVRGNPEFYAYFADYDWVVFCWLFGVMNDLPEGFPYYCKDLKQMLDDKSEKYVMDRLTSPIVSSDYYLNYCIDELKKDKYYPKQDNEHNALADARWNKKLYEFLKQL